MRKDLPKILMLNITEKCNSRCVMCGTWRKKSSAELDPGRFIEFCEKNKKHLAEVETVGLIGGEPFLSENYLDFIRAVIKYFPKIRTIGQATNSLAPDLYLKKAKEAMKIIPKNVFYGISVSLDGIGAAHDTVRGVPGAFVKASRLIERAQESFFKNDNFYLTLTTTLSKNNLAEVDKIINFAAKSRVRFSFRPVMGVDSPYIDNSQITGWQPTVKDEKMLRREFKRIYQITRNPYYDFIFNLFGGKKRKFPCPFQDKGFTVNPDGEIFMCLFSGEGHLGNMDNLLPEIFGSPQYFKIRRGLIRKSCAGCSAECYTSRSRSFNNLDYSEQQLMLLFGGRIKKFEDNLSVSKKYMFHGLLEKLADFRAGRIKSGGKSAADEEKIVFNTWLGREKYKIGIKSRSGLKFDFKRKDPGNLLLNLAKYYYFVKIYSRAQIYIDIINDFFGSQPRLTVSAGKISNKTKLL